MKKFKLHILNRRKYHCIKKYFMTSVMSLDSYKPKFPRTLNLALNETTRINCKNTPLLFLMFQHHQFQWLKFHQVHPRTFLSFYLLEEDLSRKVSFFAHKYNHSTTFWTSISTI